MTTWTMEQVGQVRRLFVTLDVDQELVARDPDATQKFAAGEMVKTLTRLGHPFGVEIDRRDCVLEWFTNEAIPWTATGRMRWKPTTKEAELRGGHLDGQRYSFEKIGEPFRVPRPAITPWWDDEEVSASASMVELADTYELAGWREGERVWVYESR